MTDLQNTIQKALARYRAIRRWRAGLVFFGTLVQVITLAALIDRTWMFMGWARWSGWIVGLVMAACAARRKAGPSCPDASALAHRVEAEAGEGLPVVATAIDPAVRRTAESDELAGLLLKRLDLRAEEAIRSAPPTCRGRLRGPAAWVVVALAALATLTFLQEKQGLLRMLLPWQDSPYTVLVLTGPTEPVAEGRAFTMTARVSGVPVDKVTLYRQDSPEPLAEAVPDAEGMVELATDGLAGPTDFVARGGDGRSEPVRVEPYSLPGIGRFEIVVTPPGYAAHAKDTKTVPSFSVFRRSRLTYRIHLKATAVSVGVEQSAAPRREEWVTDQERASLQRGPYGVLVGTEASDSNTPAGPVFRAVSGDTRIWEADWDLPEPQDIVYRLAIEGEHGDLVRNDEPWRINVLSDEPPKVRIHGHNGAEVIRLGDETVRFELGAVDDVRLAAARLIYRKPGRPHARREIELPLDTRRSWTGAELLALAPLDLGPLDIVAVHAEADDANLVDGPGVGRSEVVFLEVPLPESDDAGGGGGGGGSPPINPLELQMEILRSTMVLPHDAAERERESLAHDQWQNAKYTATFDQGAFAAGLLDLSAALGKARVSMESAARLLNTRPPFQAIADEESALGSLIQASKLLDEAIKQGLLQPSSEMDGMTFSLRPPRGQSSESQEGQEDADKERETLRDLMADVRRQLAEQKKLNQASGESGARANQQQSLARDARLSASQARGIPASSGRRGDPRAAAEELERAAGLQEDTAEALADGDGNASSQLGAKSAEALAEALRELAAQLEFGTVEGESHPPRYERLVNDYLRSISYE